MGDELDSSIRRGRAKTIEYILDAVLLLVIVQISRILLKSVLLSQLKYTYESVNIVNIISIMIVGVSLTYILKGSRQFNPEGQKFIELDNKYNNRNIRIILGGMALAGLVFSFYMEKGYLLTTSTILILSLIVVPMFEEVVFRELLWNYISNYEKDERKILIIISVLSALFKLGYWDIISQNLSVIGSSFYTVDIVFAKIGIGLVAGLVLGIAKIKFKDISVCIFIHSIINVFFSR